ncbi:MAG: sigma-70 family RNA polymerase sigma factor [Hyphomicrobiales bacterium]|nr:sigma-70 family RNA polymerase sigma factor [Hyphomicrobiales bacterium]
MRRAADPFQRLYDQNHQWVCQLLARIAGPQEAEDLAQVVFAKAARALPKFRGAAQASTWLYRIAVHVASDWLRSRSAKEAKATIELSEVLSSDASEPYAISASQATAASPELDLIRKEMRECIRGVIGQLPEKQRTVLMLGELAGFADDEVAQTLGISRANAKVRLHRARAQLREKLQVRCDFSRDEDNEFVCEPKPTAFCTSSNDSSYSRTTKADDRLGSSAL